MIVIFEQLRFLLLKKAIDCDTLKTKKTNF